MWKKLYVETWMTTSWKSDHLIENFWVSRSIKNHFPFHENATVSLKDEFHDVATIYTFAIIIISVQIYYFYQ